MDYKNKYLKYKKKYLDMRKKVNNEKSSYKVNSKYMIKKENNVVDSYNDYYNSSYEGAIQD